VLDTRSVIVNQKNATTVWQSSFQLTA